MHVRYHAWDRARMAVSNSTSDGDGWGYGVADGGQVTLQGPVVDGVVQSGTLPLPGLQWPLPSLLT